MTTTFLRQGVGVCLALVIGAGLFRARPGRWWSGRKAHHLLQVAAALSSPDAPVYVSTVIRTFFIRVSPAVASRVSVG